MFKICFFAPHDHTEKVKVAMFNAGGGKIGNYDCCSWQVAGQGQFRPGEESKPFIGSQDKIEKVSEDKVEMVCAKEKLKDVIAAMKQAHPYETPAYEIIELFEL